MTLKELVQRTQDIYRQLEEQAEDLNERVADSVRDGLETIEDLIQKCNEKNIDEFKKIRDLIQQVQDHINILQKAAANNPTLSAQLEQLEDAVEKLEDKVVEALLCSDKTSITIVVNGRPKEVKEKKLCFKDIVELAFPNAPQGDARCYTVTYKHGPSQNPEGTLVEGQCVFLKDRMVFNVSATDKS